jgi:hypothetical protein
MAQSYSDIGMRQGEKIGVSRDVLITTPPGGVARRRAAPAQA